MVLGCRGLLFAASSGDGNHLPGREDLSPPGLPVLSPEEIWLLFSLLASISDSKGLGGSTLHVLSSSSGTGSSCWSSWGGILGIFIWEVKLMQRSFSLLVYTAMENWYLHGLHRNRGFPSVGVLFSTLTPSCQTLLHWGQVSPLRMGFDSSTCPWEPCRAESNAHFRSAGDTKLGRGCTKLGGDTNLSWELPASTALAPQKSLLRLAIKCSAASAGHEGVSPPAQGFVWSLWVCNRLLCSGSAVFWGEKKNQISAKHRALWS